MIFSLRFFITAYFLLFAGIVALAAPSVDKFTLSFPPNSQTVTITNGSGKSDIPIFIKPTISGTGSADFEVATSQDLPCPSGTTPLDLGSQCKFTVTFKGTTGTSSATLTVSPDVPNLTVTLTGTAQNTVSKVTLNLEKMGTGQGTITSTPAGINCDPTCKGDFEANKPVTLTATADSTSEFAGWSPADKCPSPTTLTCTLTLTAATTITATFNLKATSKASLTVTKNGAGTVKSDPPGIDCGATCQQQFDSTVTLTLTATPDANSTFVGWTGDCSGNSTCPVTMNVAKNVTATFIPTPPPTSTTPATFSLFINKGTGEVKCHQGNCESQYPANTSLILTATPPTGFQFDGWSGDCANAEKGDCNLVMDKDKTVTANFIAQTTSPPTSTTPNTFSLSIDKGTGEVKCYQSNQSNCESKYPQNTAITLTATPPASLQFDGWSGDCAGKGDCNLVMDKDKTVKANFSPQTPAVSEVTKLFPLTINPTTGEVKCNNLTCDTQYSQGTAITLTATPKPGYEFARWEGCTPTPTDSKVCVVTMDSPKTVTATFNPVSPPSVQSFPLQVYLTGPGTGKVLCNNVECLPTQIYTANTPVTLTVVPTPGNTFTGWTGACMGNIVPCQLTISEAKTVNANFELPSPPPPPPQPVQPVMMIPVVPTCATDSTSISDTCKGQGKSLACNVTIERSANLSNVRFACDATNRGWIANSTIQTGVTVTGGVFTGYITNQGTLADFEFLGASIIGGTLAGHIVNDSKVGGYFKDVHLAAQTYITGGTLAGTLTGDCQAPATLENLKIKAGSHLSCVELGKNVKLEKNVTMEKPK